MITAAPSNLTLADLKEGNADKLFPAIESAFGEGGLGIIVVHMPEMADFHAKRTTLLGMAPKVAALPEDVKKELEHAESQFSFGWSHGKEKFEGVPDTLKGSYYAQIYERETYELEYQQKFPFYAHKNIWPSTNAMGGADLKDAFIGLGQTMTETGTLLAQRIDEFLATRHTGLPSIQKALSSPRNCHKGRLLYYFPKETESDSTGSWCGLHLDHSLLTGLTRAIFDPAVLPTSDASGLYIQTRDGEMARVTIPEDCIAFQVGEAAQILSKNVLRATPHLVKGTDAAGVNRSTFACFLQPEVDFDLGEGLTFGKFTENILASHYEDGPVML
ncbi:Clavaminate synthase-like protein [Chytriomyces sp. MP71]|nr:Clavaminate synthase-like protein [Chytriomyces sp. MP71]